MSAEVLSKADAEDLARALVATLLPRREFLIIKGSAACDLGLRQRRQSNDIDVLLQPATVPLLVAELHRRGWIDRPADPRDAIFPRHSWSLYHPKWPCDIDLHERFPGCEAPPNQTFDALQAEAVEIATAGLTVRTTGVVGTTLVLALNSLRHPDSGQDQADLDYLASKAPELVQSQQLVALAERTGSLAALRPFIDRAFPDHGVTNWPAPSTDWLIRTRTSSSASIRVHTLMQSPLSAWPRLLRIALWPSRDALAFRDISLLDAPAHRLVRLRLARLIHAIGGVRQTLKEARDLRRAVVSRRAASRRSHED